MRILKARKYKFGFVLPSPVNEKSIKLISEIYEIVRDRPAIYESRESYGNASYYVYTDDIVLGEALTAYYNSVI